MTDGSPAGADTVGDALLSDAVTTGDLAIETHGLTKRFRSQVAVDGVDLAVPRGAVFGFLGPNGSGKTTTIRMLLGLVAASAGGARVLGADMPRHVDSVLPRVGALVEGPAFSPYLSGVANLRRFDAADRHAPRGTRAARVDEALDRVGLSHAGGKKVHAYSLGMKQRLGIANALLMRRELLVLDEPTNGLDPQGTREVRALIRSLADDGTTVFVSSHLLAEVEQVCSHVGVMSAGKLVAQGTLEEFRDAGEARVLVRTPDAAGGATGADAARHGRRRRSRRRRGRRPLRVVGCRTRGHRRSAGRRRGSGAGVRGRTREPRAAVRRAHRRGVRRCPVTLPIRDSRRRRVSMRPLRGLLDHRMRRRRPAAPAARGGTLSLFASELLTLFRRRRTWALLGALALIPILIAVAIRIAGDAPSGRGPAFLGQITENGLFVGVTAMVVAIPLFLPLTIGVVAGDTIAGEASHGTLRYLLIAPAGRIRLLVVKYAATAVFCAAATLTVVVVGTLIGWALFPVGPVTLLSGATVSVGEGLLRFLAIAAYVTVSLLGLSAIGLFLSTLTTVPVGAMAATAILAVVAQIMGALPQLEWVHPWLFTEYWLGFADLLRQPPVWDSFADNALLQAGYVVVFGALAVSRMLTKDVLS